MSALRTAAPLPCDQPAPAGPISGDAVAALAWDRLSRALSRVAAAERQAARHEDQIAQLQALLVTDELTGLYNRRGLLERLAQEVQSAAGGLAVVLDLDGMRAINARFGHAVGDAYLRRAGLALCSAVRPCDVVARLAGDEFALLLTAAPPAIATGLAETIVQRFHGQRLEHAGCALPLRASFGWHPYAPGVEPRAVLAEADLMVGCAKRARAA